MNANKITVTVFIRPTPSNPRGTLEARLGMQQARALNFEIPPFAIHSMTEEAFEQEVDHLVARAKREVREALLRDLQLEI